MAYITIPQLPAGGALTGLEEFEAVQSLSSVKLTASQIRTFVTTTPSFVIDDANLNGISAAATFTHTVTGVPALGIGTSIRFSTEVAVGNVVVGSSIASVTTDLTLTQEDFALTFSTAQNGTLGEKARITSDGFLGVNTTTPAAPVDATINDTSGSAVSTGLAVTHTTATPGSGIGAAVQFRTSTGISTVTNASRIAAVATNITAGIESFDLVFSNTAAGSVNQEAARLTSTKRLGIGTSAPNATIEAVREDASTNTVLSAARLTRTVAGAGAPSAGIGTALEFSTEAQVNTNVVGAAIYTVSTSLVTSNENFDLAISTLGSGTLTECVRITSTDRVGINTTTPSTSLHVVRDDLSTNTVVPVARLTRTSSSTPANGIGGSLEFEVEAQVSTNRVGASIQAVASSVAAGSENFDLVFNTMTSGASVSEKLRIGSTSISPLAPFDFMGAGALPSATTRIRAGTNSVTVSPLQFDPTAPSLLTTAQPGGVDFNGQGLYFTPQGIERGVLASRMTYINTAGSRAGPLNNNVAQTASFTGGGSSVITTTASWVPGVAVGSTGALAIFTSTGSLPAGIVANQPYWVNYLTNATFTVSTTQGGTPLTFAGVGTGTHSVVFHYTIFGNGLSSVGLRLGANTRYMYELYFAISHSSAAATSVAYALTNQTGTLSAHYYRVTSFNSSAAFTGNLTSITPTSQSVISNFVTSGFSTFVTVTGLTAAVGNTTNLLQIQGQIDTAAACTYVIPTIGFPSAGGTSTILQGAYMMIYPIGPVVTNTSVGSWES